MFPQQCFLACPGLNWRNRKKKLEKHREVLQSDTLRSITAIGPNWLGLKLCIYMLTTRLKTHRLFQVDIDRREQCCAANYEQVINHVVPSCYS